MAGMPLSAMARRRVHPVGSEGGGGEVADSAGPKVHVVRLGAAMLRSSEARVRWVYAIECADEDAVREQLSRLESRESLGPSDIRDVLSALTSMRVLAGPAEIQAAAKADPGLRRALRAARENLRSEERPDGTANSGTKPDEGAV